MSKEIQQPGGISRKTFLKGIAAAVTGTALAGESIVDSLARGAERRSEVVAQLEEMYPNVKPITRTVTGGAGPAVASAEVVVGYEVSETSSEEEKKRIIENYTQYSARLNKGSSKDRLTDKIDLVSTVIGCALAAYGVLLLRKNRLSSAPDESLIIPEYPQSSPMVRYSDYELRLLKGQSLFRLSVGGGYAEMPWYLPIEVLQVTELVSRYEFYESIKKRPDFFERLDKKFWLYSDASTKNPKDAYIRGETYVQSGRRIWWDRISKSPRVYDKTWDAFRPADSAESTLEITRGLIGGGYETDRKTDTREWVIAIQSTTDNDWIYVGKDSGNTYFFDEKDQKFFKPTE